MVERSQWERFSESVDTKIQLLSSFDSRDHMHTVEERVYCQTPEDWDKAEQLNQLLQTLSHLPISQCFSYSRAETEGRHFACFTYKKVKSVLKQEIEKRHVGGMVAVPFSEAEVQTVLFSAVDTLAALQKMEIAHRNISPDYLHVSATGRTLLCLSFISKGHVPVGTSMGTVNKATKYWSPLLKRQEINPGEKVEHNQYKSDVYSLGITLLELILLEVPNDIHGLPNLEDNIRDVLNGLSGYSAGLKEILGKMLAFQESHRPDFLELRELLQPFSTYLPVVYFERNTNPLTLALSGVWGIRCIISCTCNVPGEIRCNLSFQVAESPHFILLMDMSGSTFEFKDSMTQFHDAFQSCVPGQIRRSLISFSDEGVHTIVYSNQTNAEWCKEEFNKLDNGDMSDIADGLKAAYELHENMNKGSVLMVVTDGFDNCGDLESALQQIERDPKIALYSYQVGDGREGGIQMDRIATAEVSVESQCEDILSHGPSTAPIHLSEDRCEAALTFQFRIKSKERPNCFPLQLTISCPGKTIAKYIVFLRLEDCAPARSTADSGSAEQ